VRVDDDPVRRSQTGELRDERRVRRSELRHRLRVSPGLVRQGAGR
jgi:hypothetical protein